MSSAITRRLALKYTGALAGAAVLGTSRRAHGAARADVQSLSVISHQGQLYHGWPTLTRRQSGELLLVCSGGRESHVCPFGRVELIRSADEGRTWTWPRVVMDGAIDDRDAGVLETSRGTILVTTFTSLAFERVLEEAQSRAADDPQAWPAKKVTRWRAVQSRLSAPQRAKELGVWMIRSTDGGVTWSARYDCHVDSPHGPIQLADGRLLYAGKQLWRAGSRVSAFQSADDGQSWQHLADFPTRPGDDATDYHELHAVEAEDGRIIAHIRNHNKTDDRQTLQSESSDGGRSWSLPRSIGVWGYPSHLLRLRDNRLLMSYGHRRKPLGNQVRVSQDNGRTWSPPLIVSGDGTSTDLGYPSTVEMSDGSLLTAWYELMKGSTHAVVRQARWLLES